MDSLPRELMLVVAAAFDLTSLSAARCVNRAWRDGLAGAPLRAAVRMRSLEAGLPYADLKCIGRLPRTLLSIEHWFHMAAIAREMRCIQQGSKSAGEHLLVRYGREHAVCTVWRWMCSCLDDTVEQITTFFVFLSAALRAGRGPVHTQWWGAIQAGKHDNEDSAVWPAFDEHRRFPEHRLTKEERSRMCVFGDHVQGCVQNWRRYCVAVRTHDPLDMHMRLSMRRIDQASEAINNFGTTLCYNGLFEEAGDALLRMNGGGASLGVN
jgi:hypothetical protein